MVTPELINYIKGELAKGRTREEIRLELSKNGGWGEVDLSDAFRTVMPLQGGLATQAKTTSSSYSPVKVILSVVILAVLCVAAWFYRESLTKILSGGVDAVKGVFSSSGENTNPVSVLPSSNSNSNSTPQTPASTVKDCGMSTAPNLKNAATYSNNLSLACLGASALSCDNAKAVINDPLFPTIFEIVQNNTAQNSCSFKLSYSGDSKLVDATNKRLAGQYISCPISIVKNVDETTATPTYKAPDTDKPSKYASEIYFYGSLGVFMEQNVDKSKILGLGCSGPYIDSVLASYNKAKAQ